MKKGVIIVTGILLLVMAIFFVQSLDMVSFNAQSIPGPGFAPKLYLGIGFIAATVVILNAIRSKENYGKVTTNSLVFKIALLAIFYIILIPVLGYLISTFITLLVVYKVLGINNWKLILSVSGGFLVVIYLIFVKFLSVPIPQGILF